MTSLNIDLLRKVWTLVERGEGGEAIAALHRAEAMVKAHGYTLSDIHDLLRDSHRESTSRRSGFDDEWMRQARSRADAHAEKEKEEARRRKAEEKKKRDEARKAERDAETAWRRAHRAQVQAIIKRCGTYDDVFKNTPDEQRLEDAVAGWYVRRETPEGGAGSYTEEWDGAGPYGTWTPRVLAALRQALPLPITIPEAIAEYKKWMELDDERRIVRRYKEKYTSEFSEIRETAWRWARIASDMACWELPAQNMQDLMQRVQFQNERECQDYRANEAILHDLARIQNIHQKELKEARKEVAPKRRKRAKTARDRRAEVERILSTPEGTSMPLRQIADLVGVSPATVLNVKRKIAGD